MTYRAAIWASVANIPDTEYPPIDHIPTVFYTETTGTHRVAPPDYYVDISRSSSKSGSIQATRKPARDFLEKPLGSRTGLSMR
jgi:hypothetical protein